MVKMAFSTQKFLLKYTKKAFLKGVISLFILCLYPSIVRSQILYKSDFPAASVQEKSHLVSQTIGLPLVGPSGAEGVYYGFEIPLFLESYIKEKKEVFLSAYPNPVQSVLTIQHRADLPLVDLTIFNAVGSLMTVDYQQEAQAVQVDVSLLKSGLYFVLVKVGNSTTLYKIVKE